MNGRLTPILLAAAIALVIVLVTLSPATAAGNKHALLIGISDYSPYYPSLQENQRVFCQLDCSQDVQRIEDALEHTFGFKPDPSAGEIVTLTTPHETTRASIIAALQRLVDVTGPGDIVYIHYSGHGDQVMDPTEPTGWDSAIVPCDYKTPAPEDKTEEATNYISGKTILHYIDAIRAKHPAQVAISFDSCHSASAARGATPLARKRGISQQEYADWYSRMHPDYHSRGPRMIVRGGPAPAQDDLDGSGYVVISACRNVDEAFETTDDPPMGRLSYCLATVLRQATPQTTYREVFEQVYAIFHEKFPDQHPQLDGSDPDAPLLGGEAVPPPASVLVLVDSPGHYTLDAGSLQGVTKGSIFSIYAKTDQDFKSGTEIATAEVSAVAATSATLTLKSKWDGLNTDDLNGAHAVETAHDYSQPPLTLDADSLRRALPGQADAILARLARLQVVSTTRSADGRPWDFAVARVAAGRGPADLILDRVASGKPVMVLDPTKADLPDEVAAAMTSEARYRYACGLGTSQPGLNPSYRIIARLVPSDSEGNPLPASRGASAGGRLVLPLNTYFIIQVQNKSRTALHLAVLDLGSEPVASVSQVWPAKATTAQDNIILPTPGDTWKTLWSSTGGDTTQKAVFQASSQDADEMYKFVGTYAATSSGDSSRDEYVDFSILTSRGESRGPDSPFSDVFGPAVDEGVRGTNAIAPTPAGTWTATTLPFEVK